MAFGEIFFEDVMICAGEGKICEDLFFKNKLYIENQIFHFPQLAKLSAQVTLVVQ